jgi:hypothetical protein
VPCSGLAAARSIVDGSDSVFGSPISRCVWGGAARLGAVASSTDAVFNLEAGYEPLRLSRRLPFLLRRAGAPFPRPRAKNGGPLQAVPVMARAMAQRLE